MPSVSFGFFAVDLLGKTVEPLIGPAKDKVNGVLKYVWAQPYGGYAKGDGTQNFSTAISTEGFFGGARGGIEVFRTLRIGADFTHNMARAKSSTDTSGAMNEMWGVGAGFDIPYTPLQGFASRYFSASLQGQSGGRGWGGGISFVLKNPFILLVEYRSLNYPSPQPQTMKQYFVGLSFLLL